MFLNSLWLKSVCLLIILFFLSNCTKAVEKKPQSARQTSTPFTMPADAYLALAKSQHGNEKQAMLLMAAGRSLYDGQSQEAAHILSQTSHLTAIQNDEKDILLAKIDFIRGQPQQTIVKLSGVQQKDLLTVFFKAQYHELLAGSYEAVGNAAAAVTERIKLERLLSDEDSHLNNRRALWVTLAKLPVAELNTIAVEAKESSELQGWMQLALIPREYTGNDRELFEQVEHWQQRYPGHPANSLLPSSLASVKSSLHDTPHQMALLLPLSGALAGPGSAVRDGFMAAHNDSVRAHASSVRYYDTAATDVTVLYQQALDEGADYIVGPLTKSDVAKIAAIEHPVPTVFLNDLETKDKSNAYRFGLSPANEARYVATTAYKHGFNRALIIAPAGSWGDEIANAFSAQWQSTGGEVVDRLSFDNSSELSQSVRTFLHVSERAAHEKQFKPVKGNKQIAVEKRRQDFDMIFLLAYPSSARQIMPLLKYYFAGDVPVYATSSVYSGSINKMSDKDLDGILFCDIPWVFNHQLANKNWPEQFNSYSRLYALGVDSYALSTQLNKMQLFPTMGVNDGNGVLYLNQAQQVARALVWGKFRGGIAEQISETI